MDYSTQKDRLDEVSLLVIVGLTASGKSTLALKVAKDFDGEIISADSWQVYRGFDIGTAKPSKAQQAEIKHHLIDVADAREGFNAPRFKELAENAISDIQNRGKLPILVGGTGLYIDSVIYDFGFLPNLGPDARAELDAMKLPELEELAKRTDIDLSGVDTRNKRRVIRAIEAGGQKPSKTSLRTGTLIVGVKPPADQLRGRVEKRVEQMIATGLEQEVKALAGHYGWEIEPMKGIGYWQWKDYFAGSQSLAETRGRIVKATLDLAKRQWTYLKRNKQIIWFENPEKAYDFLAKKLPEH